jgi:hypothetical protein
LYHVKELVRGFGVGFVRFGELIREIPLVRRERPAAIELVAEEDNLGRGKAFDVGHGGFCRGPIDMGAMCVGDDDADPVGHDTSRPIGRSTR